ncbi:MAG: hypothetical protein OYM47_20735 [Gemmatimonadota bacterium]|nr:hypothetical protein [Gemmatimonadota bacterium]
MPSVGGTFTDNLLDWTSVLAGPESTAHVDETFDGPVLVLPAEVRGKLDAASVRYGERLEQEHRPVDDGTG